MNFTKLEQEAIILNAVLSMIDDMVNHTIFCRLDSKTEETNLAPKNSTSLRLFAILLRDFLAPLQSKYGNPLPFGLPPSKTGTLTDNTKLFYLKEICKDPLIGDNLGDLPHVVESFSKWLEADSVVKEMWFSNIDLEVDLTIKRIEFILMVGDIGKHNFLNLGGQTYKLKKILGRNGIIIDENQAYAALPNCWDWFHDNLLSYHASTIAEFLNNIRYAIRAYVSPVADATYKVTWTVDELLDMHTFDRPNEIRNEFAWGHYRSLLNSTLNAPYFPKFTVHENFKSSL